MKPTIRANKLRSSTNITEDNKPVHVRATQLIEELELNENLKGMSGYYGDFFDHLLDFIVDLEQGHFNTKDKS